MAIINRIVLHNFKRFKYLELELNDDINIFIGDNESGKSSILQAVDLTIRGSRHKVEDIGLDKLFNVEETISFMRSDRNYANLPKMFVELYLDEQNNLNLSGINNSKHMNCDGLKFVCSPNDELSSQINNVLSSSSQTFPFEFYKIEFSTFQGGTYTGHNKYMRDIFLDNSMIGSEYAMSEFVRDIFSANLSEQERHEARWTYRQQKDNFKTENLNQYSGLSMYYPSSDRGRGVKRIRLMPSIVIELFATKSITFRSLSSSESRTSYYRLFLFSRACILVFFMKSHLPKLYESPTSMHLPRLFL